MDATDFYEEVQLRENGSTLLQDQQVLYAAVSTRLNEANRILSESTSPTQAIAIAESFLQTARAFAMPPAEESGSVGFIGLPPAVRMPAISSNARKRGAAEDSQARSKRASSSGSH